MAGPANETPAQEDVRKGREIPDLSAERVDHRFKALPRTPRA